MSATELSPGYLKIPPRLNMGEWVVDRHVREGRGGHVAVYVGDSTYTYDEIRRRSNRVGNALRGLGIKRGDRILLRLGTNLDCMLAFLGALKIGAVPAPTSSMLREQEVGVILRNSEAVAAIAMPDLAAAIGAVRGESPRFAHLLLAGEATDPARSLRRLMERASEELTPELTGPNDPAFMMYTSGTTGQPKGVEHGHRWIIGTGDPITKVMTRLGPSDICFQPQDWSFIYPLGCNFLYPFYAGAAVVLPPGRFDPEQAFATIERYRVTVFCAVPTIYRIMLAVPEAERSRLGSLRMGVSAGEPLPADTFREWQERLGVTIYDGIGQTESHIFLANRVGMPIKPGSMGKPLPGYEVRIADDEGKPAPVGEPGHLVIRNDHPGLTLGYYRDPERWAEVSREGWYDTKDFAYVDEDGYYWYVSRSDDLIKSRAYLISPKEVESAIMEHPAVLEAGVVGVPDPLIGQKVRAYVTLKPGFAAAPALAEEIKRHTRGVIAPYKAPQEVEFVSDLPKTLTGKVLRRQLREKA